MRTKSKITGLALSSLPVFLINKGIDFKFNAAKREISVSYEAEYIKEILKLWEFTDEMLTVTAVK